MVRLFGLTQVSELTLSTRVLQLTRPHWDSVTQESTLTKTPVDVDWGKTSPRHRWLSGTPRQQGFSLGLRPACPVSWNLRCPFSPVCKCIQSLICSFQPVLLMFVLCYSLIKNMEKLHMLQNILLYTVLSKLVMKKWFILLSCHQLCCCMDERYCLHT